MVEVMIMNDKPLEETETFLIRSRYLFKKMNQQITRHLKEYGVDASEIICLMLLHRNEEGLSLRELTNLSMTDKSMTTKVVKNLEKKLYIYRDRKNTTSRNYKVYLTPLGIEKANQIEGWLQQKKNCFEKTFTKKEQAVLREAWNCLLAKYI